MAAGDAFFTNPRPFTTRKKEDGPNNRSGTSTFRRGATRGATRGAGRGAARGGATRGSAGRGRGAARGGRGGEQDRKGKRKADQDEELDEPEDGNGSFDSDSPMEEDDEDSQSESEDDTETPAQKRLRLSQMYLKSLEKDTTGGEQLVPAQDGWDTDRLHNPDDIGFNAADLDRDLIAERLQQDVVRSPLSLLHATMTDESLRSWNIPESYI